MSLIESELSYPQDLIGSIALEDILDNAPKWNWDFFHHGTENQGVVKKAENPMGSDVFTVSKSDFSQLMPFNQNMFINEGITENETLFSENPEFLDVVKNNYYYEKMFNYENNNSLENSTIQSANSHEDVSAFFPKRDVGFFGAEGGFGNHGDGGDFAEQNTQAKYGVFEGAFNGGGKEVHIHNEIPVINIEFSGNIEKDVDFEALLRNMQKRIREEMESDSDFSYSY
ncbi:MAG: hypothetical protein RR219_08615 [Clostridiales bacterium]